MIDHLAHLQAPNACRNGYGRPPRSLCRSRPLLVLTGRAENLRWSAMAKARTADGDRGGRPTEGPARGFPPIAAADARVLILGSMPSVRSLAERQYYGHPRNAFWPIMGELFGAGPELPYPERGRVLRAHRVAVWDVLASCVRPGSLDADIEAASAEVNDLDGFLRDHPDLRLIAFNGTAAERYFQRRVLPDLGLDCPPRIRLPSTSPAHAALTLAHKSARWRAALANTVPG